jgi:hypothetical protein
MEDFLKLQRDIDTIPEEELLRDYLLTKEEGLEAEEEGSFWRMRCSDEMPQILTGEKAYWEKVILIKD